MDHYLDDSTRCVNDAHAEIKTGDILVWRQDRTSAISNAFLTLVRFATQSDFAHVGVALRLEGRLFVVEATIPKVRIIPVTYDDEFYHVATGVAPSESSVDWLLSVVGVDYSFLDCLRAYLGMRLDRLGAYQCAELAHEFLSMNGVHLGETFTPTKLVNALLHRKGVTMDAISVLN